MSFSFARKEISNGRSMLGDFIDWIQEASKQPVKFKAEKAMNKGMEK